MNEEIKNKLNIFKLNEKIKNIKIKDEKYKKGARRVPTKDHYKDH